MQTTRYACPCCGYLTLPESPPGTYEICEVCFWEDDVVQFDDPSYEGGANEVSLNQARANYRELGVSEPRFRENVRLPRPDERP
jgi:Cysteine-rich CPCC